MRLELMIFPGDRSVATPHPVSAALPGVLTEGHYRLPSSALLR